MLVFSEISGEELDNFSKKHGLGNIHQASMWADFQSDTEGRGETKIFGVKDGDIVVAAACVVKQKLPFGLCWYFVPRGPLCNSQKDFDALMGGIYAMAKRSKSVFIRIEPPSSDYDFISGWGHKAHAHYYPQHSLMINLDTTEEEILKQMKPKGRYNIKVAEKSGVVVKVSKNVADFYQIFEETTERDKFSGHSLKYYEKMVDTLGDHVKLYLAEVEGKVVAGIIVTFYKDTAIYYFGASSNEYRNCMAPYLLQWTAMKDAKKTGMKSYDLFGIAPEGEPNHPWAGITDFKMKFGGRRVEYAQAREKIVSPFWYFAIRIRKLIAGR